MYTTMIDMFMVHKYRHARVVTTHGMITTMVVGPLLAMLDMQGLPSWLWLVCPSSTWQRHWLIPWWSNVAYSSAEPTYSCMRRLGSGNRNRDLFLCLVRFVTHDSRDHITTDCFRGPSELIGGWADWAGWIDWVDCAVTPTSILHILRYAYV